ncbi:MAG: anti-sigma factor [Acidimicrobiia bacterium]|nr:anti-sigma factor [Acidimicrobiia bacterium]
MGMVRHGTCVGTRRRLSDLCDGELAAQAEARVRRHLAGCGRCCRALARLEATIVDMGRLRAANPPEMTGLRDRVERRILQGRADADGRQDGGR